jgi:hypothetical protein
MTLLQLLRSAVLRFYYSLTGTAVSEKLVPYMHHTVNRHLFIINTFKYKNKYFYVSVYGTLYAVHPFWF